MQMDLANKMCITLCIFRIFVKFSQFMTDFIERYFPIGLPKTTPYHEMMNKVKE